MASVRAAALGSAYFSVPDDVSAPLYPADRPLTDTAASSQDLFLSIPEQLDRNGISMNRLDSPDGRDLEADDAHGVGPLISKEYRDPLEKPPELTTPPDLPGVEKKLRDACERHNIPSVFIAIINKEDDQLFRVLNQFTERRELQLIMNEHRILDPQYAYYTPLQLCYAIGRFKLAKILRTNYCGDLFYAPAQEDASYKNALHVVVDLAREYPERADHLWNEVRRLSEGQGQRMKALIEGRFEDEDPLVYAISRYGDVASADRLLLGSAFRTVTEQYGLYSAVTYNLETYESAPYEDKRFSPLHALLGLRADHLESSDSCDTLRKERWINWIERKWQAHVHVIYGWVVLKLLHLIIMTILSVNRPKTFLNTIANVTAAAGDNDTLSSDAWRSDPTDRHAYIGWTIAEVFLLIMSGTTLFMEACRLLTRKNLNFVGQLVRYSWRRLRRMKLALGGVQKPRGAQLLNSRVFWLLNLMMHSLVVVSFILRAVGHPHDAPTFSMAVCLAYLTLVEFSYLIPVLGHYAIVVERTLTDIFYFAIFFVCILLGVATGMYTLFKDTEDEELKVDFGSFPRAIFKLFHMTFNPISTSQLYNSKMPLIAILLFTIYAVIAVILLLNFLIAIMSTTVESINNTKDVLFYLNRLNIAYFLENVTALKMLRECCRSICGKRKYKPNLVLSVYELEEFENDEVEECEEDHGKRSSFCDNRLSLLRRGRRSIRRAPIARQESSTA